MFLLKDLPTSETFKKFKADYPDLDIPRTALFLRLLRVGSDLMTILDAYLRPFGLTHGRWITLILLHREDTHRVVPSVLANKQGVKRATMTNLLDRLERDALVRRVACNQDGRSVQVELTKAGKQKLDEIMPGYYRMVKGLFREIESTTIKEMTQVLDELRRGLKGIE
ncbi:MAG: MarR family transcriptional regulator [Desulfosarcinaceae bacterium]|nr:MarR family transcriptional regulator [Desulfosarcinaceae bacterium]